MDKPDLSGQNTYEKVKLACEFLLHQENKTSSEETLSSTDLFNKVKQEFPNEFNEDFSKNTFYQYLSNTVRDTDSNINCLGRRQGYYLSEVAELSRVAEDIKPEVTDGAQGGIESQSEAVEIQEESVPQRRLKEKLLYPLLKSWLIAQGYQAEVISSGRSLGKWGNPDVAGISALDAFNGLSIELVTVEVKTSLDDWEQWIFEAISHRRFANRSYFAFAHPEETISKIPTDMRYYAELYNIGVALVHK